MARAKKTTSSPAVKTTYALTEEQFQVIKNVSRDLLNIRSTLEDLEGNEDLSTIMFRVGQSAYMANKAEDQLDEAFDLYSDDCEDCDGDNF